MLLLSLLFACTPDPVAIETGPERVITGTSAVQWDIRVLSPLGRPIRVPLTIDQDPDGIALAEPGDGVVRVQCDKTGRPEITLRADLAQAPLPVWCLPGLEAEVAELPPMPLGDSAELRLSWHTTDQPRPQVERLPWVWSVAPEGVAAVSAGRVFSKAPGDAVLHGTLGQSEVRVPVSVFDPMGPERVVGLFWDGKLMDTELMSIGPDGGLYASWLWEGEAQVQPQTLAYDPLVGAIWSRASVESGAIEAPLARRPSAEELRDHRPLRPCGSTVLDTPPAERLQARLDGHPELGEALSPLLEGRRVAGLSLDGRTLVLSEDHLDGEDVWASSWVVDLEAESLEPVRVSQGLSGVVWQLPVVESP